MVNTCLICGHGWEARVDLPLQCPKCKRYDWNKIKGELNPSKEGDASNSKDDVDSREIKKNISRLRRNL